MSLVRYDEKRIPQIPPGDDDTMSASRSDEGQGPEDILDDVIGRLAKKSLIGEDYWAIADMVEAKELNLLLPNLREGIAAHILEEDPACEGRFRCGRVFAPRLLVHYEDGLIGFPDDLVLPDVNLRGLPPESIALESGGGFIGLLHTR